MMTDCSPSPVLSNISPFVCPCTYTAVPKHARKPVIANLSSAIEVLLNRGPHDRSTRALVGGAYSNKWYSRCSTTRVASPDICPRTASTLRQPPDVGRRADPREGPALVAVPAIDHLRRLAVLADEPRQLGARVARGLRQIALHHRLRGLVQGTVAEPRRRSPDTRDLDPTASRAEIAPPSTGFATVV